MNSQTLSNICPIHVVLKTPLGFIVGGFHPARYRYTKIYKKKERPYVHGYSSILSVQWLKFSVNSDI